MSCPKTKILDWRCSLYSLCHVNEVCCLPFCFCRYISMWKINTGDVSIHWISLLVLFYVSAFYFFHFAVPFAYNSNPYTPTKAEPWQATCGHGANTGLWWDHWDFWELLAQLQSISGLWWDHWAAECSCMPCRSTEYCMLRTQVPCRKAKRQRMQLAVLA